MRLNVSNVPGAYLFVVEKIVEKFNLLFIQYIKQPSVKSDDSSVLRG